MVKIKSVGVELEGGIPYSSIKELEQEYGKNFSYGQDGSVSVSDGDDEDWVSCTELRYWVMRWEIEQLYDFIKQAFKLGLKQNETCGNHLHFSLNSEADLMLVSYLGFWRYFKREVRKWNDERVNKRFGNRYCSGLYREGYENYVKDPVGRYRAINFEARYKHEDKLRMEVRLLPYADSANQLIKWIKDLVKIIEDFPPANKRLVLTERAGEVNIDLEERREVVEIFTPSNHRIVELPHIKREISCVLLC